MDNMEIYSKLSCTPQEAQKQIEAGRLKGFTDINPMWRIKRLTELFGPCGVGWKYEILKQEIVTGSDGTAAAFVTISLFYKADGKWSDAVQGVGGSTFIAKEKNGLYTNDECFKMALTDAIGTACKSLGMSADIYFAKDRTKYNSQADPAPIRCLRCGKEIKGVQFPSGEKYAPADIVKISLEKTGSELCWNCLRNDCVATASGMRR